MYFLAGSNLVQNNVILDAYQAIMRNGIGYKSIAGIRIPFPFLILFLHLFISSQIYLRLIYQYSPS